jgi:uncharacterized protein DUF1566
MRQLSLFLGTVGLSLLGMIAMATVAPVSTFAGGPQDQNECEGILPGDGQGGTDLDFGLDHGPALRYKDRLDGTFTDENTGLQWEKKTGTLGTPNPYEPHDVNTTYSWSASGTDPDGTLFTDFLNTLNNTCNLDLATACTTNKQCANSGKGKCGFAGHRDWRIPNVKELQSIVDYSKFNPSTSVPGVTAPHSYWSSTSNADTVDFPGDVWVVPFDLGGAVFGGKPFGNYARAVRGCQ